MQKGKQHGEEIAQAKNIMKQIADEMQKRKGWLEK